MFWPSHCFTCCFQGRKLLVRLEQTLLVEQSVFLGFSLIVIAAVWLERTNFVGLWSAGKRISSVFQLLFDIQRCALHLCMYVYCISCTYVCIYIYIWYTVSNPLIFVMKSCLSRSTPFVFVFVHQLIESWCFTHPWEISKTSETPKTKNRHGNNMETTDIKHPWAWNDVKRRETAGAWPESVRTRPIECKAIGQFTWYSAFDKALRRTRNWRRRKNGTGQWANGTT